MTISLNPGFALLIAAALILATPHSLRMIVALAAALAAGALALTPDFGAHDMFRQVGLTVVPLRLDAASQVFGLAFTGGAIILALAGADRRDAVEDAALLAHVGGALTAVYGGDLITFVVGAEISILAGFALIACGRTPQARAAAIRFLIWQAIAGALLVVGAGLVWSQTGDVRFDRLDAATPAGLCFALAILIRAAAPMAHVWLKDAAPRASVAGFAALATFTPILSIYALLRLFTGEPWLAPIGAAAVAVGLAFAAAERAPRRILAYGIVAQTGLMVMALGVGAPLLIAGVAALAFTTVFASLLSALSIGWATVGTPRAAADAPPLWSSAPVATMLAIGGGAAAMATPGFATFAAGALFHEALARQGADWMVVVNALAIGGAVFAAGVKAPLTAYFGANASRAPAPPFTATLAAFVALFVLLGIGVAPGWLFALLPPSSIAFAAYDWDHLVARLQVIVAALLAFALVALPGAAALRRRFSGDAPIVDVDRVYRRGGVLALTMLARGLGALFTRWNAVLESSSAAARRLGGLMAGLLDVPAPSHGRAGQWALVGLLAILTFCFVSVG